MFRFDGRTTIIAGLPFGQKAASEETAKSAWEAPTLVTMEGSSQAMTAILSCSILEINRIKKAPVSLAQKYFASCLSLSRVKDEYLDGVEAKRCAMDIRATRSVIVGKFKIFLDEMQRQFRNKKLSFCNERLFAGQNAIQTMADKDYTNERRECGGENLMN